MSKLSIVSVCLLGLLGCGRIENHHVTTGKPRAPVSGAVRVEMEGAPALGGFEEVAIVQSVGFGNKAKLEELIVGLKQEALSLGCNAVVRVRVDQGHNQATAVGVAGVLTGQ